MDEAPMGESPNEDTGSAQQAGEVAKQEASATAGQAKTAAGEVAGTAKEQAQAVTEQASEQARTAVVELRERAGDEMQSQAKKAAGNLRQWADDLADMAEKARPDSPAGSLIAQAADGSRRAASTLEQRGVGGLVEDVESFARRKPGTFLGGAVLAGFVVGHLAKAGRKAGQSNTGPSPTSSRAPQSTPSDLGTGGQPGYGEPEGPRYREVS
ncbi:hypothetical protein [Streptomyces sp. NPDC051776]|uniref:hypothetical protein n=1 Tax=Streptomyces sp. NPDC051776 TaxID=3155414 RepID=UPI0034381CC2